MVARNTNESKFRLRVKSYSPAKAFANPSKNQGVMPIKKWPGGYIYMYMVAPPPLIRSTWSINRRRF